MGLIDTLMGRASDAESAAEPANVCRISRDHHEVTYRISPESHDVAYAIPVTGEDLDALETLLETEREEPVVGGGDEELERVVEIAMGEDGVDPSAVTEGFERPRQAAAAALESWRELLDEGGPGVAYVPVGFEEELTAYVMLCRERDTRDDDPFELPERFDRVGSLLVRIRRATDRGENRVVVNQRHLPTVDPEE